MNKQSLIIFNIPVLFNILKEIKRYDGMKLKELGFHTTSDRTSKSSGDIEIFDRNNILDFNIIRISDCFRTNRYQT